MKENGIWRTILGNRVFIKEGQTVREAYKEHRQKVVKEYLESKRNKYKLNIQYFSEKALKNQTVKELKNGIKSIKKEIELHKEKISNPEKFINNYKEKTNTIKKELLINGKKK